jgi:hypothetical protein
MAEFQGIEDFPWKDQYHDLGWHLMNKTSYVDWEGFTSSAEVLGHIRWIRDAIRPSNGEAYNDEELMILDVTLHWVYDNIDQGDYTPTESETKAAAYTIEWLLGGARLWAKVSAEVYWNN